MREGRISASHGLLASDAFFPREQQNFIPKDSSESGVFSQHSLPQILHPPPPVIPTQLSQYWEQPLGKRGSFELHLQGPRERKAPCLGLPWDPGMDGQGLWVLTASHTYQ